MERKATQQNKNVSENQSKAYIDTDQNNKTRGGTLNFPEPQNVTPCPQLPVQNQLM